MFNRVNRAVLGAVVALTCFCVNASGQAPEATAATPIKIALAGPTSGNKAQYGQMQLLGAQAAIEMINAQGGVNGTPLQAVVFDDACDAEQAVRVAKEIIQQEIDYVVGHLCSSSTQAASSLYQEQGILMITPASTSPAITERGFDLVFRTIGLDNDQGPTASHYINKHIKPERVAILHDQQQYGLGLAANVRDQLRELGTQVVLFEAITPGEADFSALIEQLQRRKVDLVYYGGYHPELAMLLRQAKAQGFNGDFMGPEGVGNKDLTAHAGEAAEGLMVTMPNRYHLLPANQPVLDHLKAQQQETISPFIWTSYAAVQSLVAALESGAQNGVEVADFLHNHSVNTVMGKLSWNLHGDLAGFSFGVYRWHADNHSTLLEH